MGGFMGFGQTATEKSGEQKLGNVFNWALPEAQKGQAVGGTTLAGALSPLKQAQQYFSNLMTAGRTQAAAQAAPAIQAAQAGAEATRRQEATMGTARGGGTAAASREAATTTGKSIDDIIAGSLLGGREAGAKGLVGVSGAQAGIGEAQLAHVAKLLGISEIAAQSIFETGTEKASSSASDWIRALI